MKMIQVHFYGGLAERTGCAQVNLELEAISVEQLLLELGSRYPQAGFEGVLVAVDGVSVRKDKLVKEGSAVALLPPIAGG